MLGQTARMRTPFITFEGGEGAGKSTQLRLLAEALRARGREVVETREPGGAPGAELLRALLLGGSQEFAPQAEMLLHFAARAEHTARTIRPALAAGRTVLCDRFFDSTEAYQVHGQGASAGDCAALIRLIDPHPALTFVLEVPEAVSTARQAARGRAPDRYDRLGAEFHARVTAGFRAIAAREPERCLVLDGARPADVVAADILAAVLARCP